MEHVPVLLAESLEFLAIKADGRYIDFTTGMGGHTRAIAGRLTTGRVLALDQDAESLEQAKQNTQGLHERIVFRHAAFSQMDEAIRAEGWDLVDGMIADLGVSKVQLTTPERGFSLMNAGPLDMRMNRQSRTTAADIIAGSSEQELVRLFMELGGERRIPAQKAARAIRARPIRDTRHLAEVVASAVPRVGKLHPATRIFQALRIAVNDESAELDALLAQAPRYLKQGGRWVVIAFHSGEDRKVKNTFRDMARAGLAKVLTKHVVRPGPEETRRNPPSRSAVLRALEMGQGGSNEELDELDSKDEAA